MRYASEDDAMRAGVNIHCVGNIHRSGSVRGMQLRYGWPRGGQIRIGSWVYNVGADAVERILRAKANRP